MTAHQAHVRVRCPHCGASAQLCYTAAFDAARLRWSSSFRCASCSSATEADGGELTDDVREAFYAQQGRWSLTVRDLGARRVEALRALQQLLHCRPLELPHLVREASPAFTGALVEIERIHAILVEHGVDCIMRRLPE